MVRRTDTSAIGKQPDFHRDIHSFCPRPNAVGCPKPTVEAFSGEWRTAVLATSYSTPSLGLPENMLYRFYTTSCESGVRSLARAPGDGVSSRNQGTLLIPTVFVFCALPTVYGSVHQSVL